jgi:protein TonB
LAPPPELPPSPSAAEPSVGPLANAEPNAPEPKPLYVIPFSDAGDDANGVRRPELVVRTPVYYTKEAAAQNVQGVAVVKCIIELDGSLSHCSIVRGLPYMNESILASVAQWRYTPVMFRGHPQRVEMNIVVRVLPPSPPPRPAASSESL